MPFDQILLIVLAICTIVGVVTPYVLQLKFVSDRPGLARLLKGCANAAARLKQSIPAGSTQAQAESAIASEVFGVMSNYSDSMKATKATREQVTSEIKSALYDKLPPGHIAANPLPTPAPTPLDVDSAVAQLKAAIVAKASAEPDTRATGVLIPPSLLAAAGGPGKIG